MTTVQQTTDSVFTARATRRDDGRWSVDITGKGSTLQRIADPKLGGGYPDRFEIPAEVALDVATDDAGFYRSGDYRRLDDGTIEWDAYPEPARPDAPAWADPLPRMEATWGSHLAEGGLSSFNGKEIGAGVSLSQEVTARLGGQPVCGPVEILVAAEDSSEWIGPDRAREIAAALLKAADEVERINAAEAGGR